MEKYSHLKIYKNNKLLGPRMEGFFKSVAESTEGGGMTYTMESFDKNESWLVSFSPEDVKRMAGSLNPVKAKTYGELAEELNESLQKSKKR